MKLTIDFETRSKIDLKKCGLYRYAEDPSTDILCLAVKIDTQPAQLWVPEKFRHYDTEGLPGISSEELQKTIMQADIIEAHNATFERIIWYHIMHSRYGFNRLDPWKICCSAAIAASYALPRSLEGVGDALSLDIKKDKEGKKVMLRLARPRKPTKNNPKIWHDDPEDFKKLCAYCLQDVEAEHAVSSVLGSLSEQETRVYWLDQKINDIGFPVDPNEINTLISKINCAEYALLEKSAEITDGEVKSPRQIKSTTDWLATQGVVLADLQKSTVSEALETNLPDKARELLLVRQSLGKSSVSKIYTMQKWMCLDYRIKGSLLYHGASTGCWSGKGSQPHNFPRASFDNESDVENMIAMSPEMAEMVYGDTFNSVVKCLRGLIKSPKGKKFFCADFSAIEARILAWVAGEKNSLDAFENGLDLYKVAAAGINNTSYDNVSKNQRLVGKVATLALGYQGWVDAFSRFGAIYGIELSEQKTTEIVSNWRKSNPNTVALWAALENAAIKTVETGKPHKIGKVSFGIIGRFLHVKLPSGRLLSYCDPKLETNTSMYAKSEYQVTFMSVNSVTKKWEPHSIYGGKWAENIVQAIAADYQREALLRIDRAGYTIVLHVHDEILIEIEENAATQEEFEAFKALMAQKPKWALDCPMAVDGWIGRRFRK